MTAASARQPPLHELRRERGTGRRALKETNGASNGGACPPTCPNSPPTSSGSAYPEKGCVLVEK